MTAMKVCLRRRRSQTKRNCVTTVRIFHFPWSGIIKIRFISWFDFLVRFCYLILFSGTPVYGFVNGMVKCNEKLAELTDITRPMLRDAVEAVNKVKMMIMFLIPRYLHQCSHYRKNSQFHINRTTASGFKHNTQSTSHQTRKKISKFPLTGDMAHCTALHHIAPQFSMFYSAPNFQDRRRE